MTATPFFLFLLFCVFSITPHTLFTKTPTDPIPPSTSQRHQDPGADLIVTTTQEEIYEHNQVIETSKPTHHQEKEWNFIVYIAANNNLHKYALKNFRQMLQVGSNEQLNILVQLDEYGEEEANRFYIEKNKAVIKAAIAGKEAISGTPESLFNFIEWAITSYKARRQAIVLWNHGSGIKDPSIWGKFYKEHRDDLFSLDEQTGLLQLNRRSLRSIIKRGIGFNDVHEQYLDNQQLRLCFERIKKELLGEKKVDVVLLDACHMSMIELASKFKFFTNYLVGSEELEPGSGYNYKKFLSIFLEKEVTPLELATHAVNAYNDEYKDQIADYTQSAIALENFETCEKKISAFASYMKDLMIEHHDYVTFIKKIRRDDEMTTEFCDWDYIDAAHFFDSVNKRGSSIIIENNKKNLDNEKLAVACTLAKEAYESIVSHIVANASGVNLPSAHGLSIYFPEKNIHKSYPKTTFAHATTWPELLAAYLKKKK